VTERKSSAKKPGKKNPKALPVAVIFWTAFFIIITGVFLINRETIKKNFTLLAQRFNLPAGSEPEETEPSPDGGADSQAQPSVPLVVQSLPAAPETPPASPATTSNVPAESTSPPSSPKPSSAPPASSVSEPGQKPASQPVVRPSAAQPSSASQPLSVSQPVKPVESRERSIYFIQVENDGAILSSKVSRKIAVSDSPMLDSLNALLAGPNAEEQRRGLVSLLPRNTRILSATVRSSTAYISFSEDFQYNTYGVEGYAAQLKQIIWTVTEFSNIKDVQILIEGRRVDYLGEGIWIGSPVNRDSF
jgi:outer membrane biosynthesis protein TonB